MVFPPLIKKTLLGIFPGKPRGFIQIASVTPGRKDRVLPVYV